jgi:hypothetical protein
MQLNYETSPKMLISKNTEELILSRAKDDYRVHFTHYILFGKEIRKDIDSSIKGSSISPLREAKSGDTFTYSLIPDYEMIKLNLEQNLTNIATLKAKRQLDDLRRVWIFCYDITEEEANKVDGDPTIMIYMDPDAADVSSIIKKDRIILGVFIVIEYDTPETAKNPNLGSAKINWCLISSADNQNIDEYNQYLRDKEAESLSELFYLKFDSKKQTQTDDIK